jgi:flagellar motor switch protein FliM
MYKNLTSCAPCCAARVKTIPHAHLHSHAHLHAHFHPHLHTPFQARFHSRVHAQSHGMQCRPSAAQLLGVA